MSTRIEWTDETWNPTVGCSIVSPGCTNCYAMKMAHRVGPNFPHYAGLTRMTKGGPVWTGNVSTAPDRAFLKPLRWRDPRRIFVNSMSDLFHEGIADEIVNRGLAVIALGALHDDNRHGLAATQRVARRIGGGSIARQRAHPALARNASGGPVGERRAVARAAGARRPKHDGR